MEPRSEAGEWQKEWPFDPVLPSISEADEARESALDAVAEAVGRERLTDNTGQPDDEAYNRALDDVLRIIEEARRG